VATDDERAVVAAFEGLYEAATVHATLRRR
jgi:hypothetical protein